MRALMFAALLLVTFLAIVFVPTAFAQTHPCDQANPTTFQVRRADAVKVGWCHQPVEDDGTPISLGQIHFYLLDMASRVLLDLGVPSPMTGPNGTGDYYYESTQRTTFAADVNVVVVAEYNGVQAASSPITIDVRGGPKAPTGLRILDTP